jgi:hypothetical protein
MPAAKTRITLPVRIFLYTMDQLAAILGVEEETLIARYLYFQGLSTGIQGKRMLARNIEIDPEQPARWRVAESEVLRYMRERGFIVERDRV